MSLLIAILLLLSVFSRAYGCGNNVTTELSDLVNRIIRESDSVTTVVFVGVEDGVLSNFFLSSSCDIPVVIFKINPTGPTHTKELLFNAILVVQTQTSYQEQQYDLIQRLIPKLQTRKFVITLAFDKAGLLESFLFFHKHKFTRVYGMDKGLSSYAYLPFAETQVQKIADKSSLVDGYKDLNGFTFRTTIHNDIPRVFRYPDKQGQLKVGGCYGQIFMQFLRRHNANYEEVIINDCDGICFPKILTAINDSRVDISMNVYAPVNGFDHSYPVKTLGLTVMVALNGHLDRNQYFVRPFSTQVWLAIGFTAIYIILMDLVKNLNFNLTVDDIWKSFSQLLLMMLNSSSGAQINNHYRFYAQVLGMTFILGNIYNNYFTSYLTVFIKMKQYETLQDLIDNNIRVMVADYELKTFQETNISPPGYEKLFYPTEYSVYAQERNSMNNTKFAYFAGADRAEFLIGLQQHFDKPLFHTTSEYLSKAYTVFILKENSPFKEILDTFIVQVLETGLIMKWDSDAITQSLLAGFETSRSKKDQPLHRPLGVKHLVFAWNILGVGLPLAFIVFGGEFMLKKYKYILSFEK